MKKTKTPYMINAIGWIGMILTLIILAITNQVAGQCYTTYQDSIDNPLDLDEPLTLYFDQGTYTCIAREVNGDLQTYGHTAQLLQILGALGDQPSMYDFDQSGSVSVSDLLALLAGFGSTNTELPLHIFHVESFHSSGMIITAMAPWQIDGVTAVATWSNLMRTGFDETPGQWTCLHSFEITTITTAGDIITYSFIQ